MHDESRQLFADGNQDFTLPTLAVEIDNEDLTDEEIEAKLMGEDQHLVTHGVEDAISGETVKALLIPEETDIYLPNFVLDFSEATLLRKHQIACIDSFIVETGDTALYIYIKGAMNKVGMIDGAQAEAILPTCVAAVFGDKDHKNCQCKLYKDVERGKPVNEISEADISTLRLKI